MKTLLKLTIALALILAAYLGFRSSAWNADILPVADERIAAKATGSSEIDSEPALRTQSVAVNPVAIKPVRTARVLPYLPGKVRTLMPSLQRVIPVWSNYNPEQLVVAPFPDTPMAFDRVSFHQEHGRGVWVGRNSEEGAFLVTASSDREMRATLTVPGADVYEFVVSNTDGNVTTMPVDDVVLGEPLVSESSATISLEPSKPMDVATPAAPLDVDLTFFFNEEALAEGGGLEALITVAIVRVAAMNEVLVNSEITNFKFRYINGYALPSYETTDDLTDDIYQIARFGLPWAFGKERMSYDGSDLGILLVGGTRQFAGRGEFGGVGSAVVLKHATALVMVHELGHNFGCLHDRFEEGATNWDGEYNYGHIFEETPTEGWLKGVRLRYGSVMSYRATRIPYFSNPDVFFTDPLLTKPYPTGVEAGQARGAHNARVMIAEAPKKAALGSPPQFPSITEQPVNATMPVGQIFEFRVMATGGNLSYQWRKDGKDIEGANIAKYLKVGAAESDQGAYSVVVSNRVGSVTSSSATFKIGTAQSTTSTSGGSSSSVGVGGGSSGGGGGAPSHYFIAALGALVALRRFRRS